MSIRAYEEGVNAGIEQGQHLLLVKLLNKVLGEISEKYLLKLEDLENTHILNIAMNIFDIKTYDDLDRYLA